MVMYSIKEGFLLGAPKGLFDLTSRTKRRRGKIYGVGNPVAPTDAAAQISIRTDLFVPTPIKADATREVVQKRRPNAMRNGHILQGGLSV